MYNNPQEVLSAWLDGVNRGDMDRVLNLYAKGSVLLPTFSEKILNDRTGIQGYFLNLGKRGVDKVTLRRETLIVQDLSHSVFALSGLYDWKFSDGSLVEARFTYTVNITKTSPITHHHSSALPKASS